MTAASDPHAMAERLREVARRFAGGACEIEGLQRLSGGASQETWRFTLIEDCKREGSTRTDHVLRRVSPANDGQASDLQAGLRAEAALLTLAASNGVPVPHVRAVLEAGDGLGEGFIMPFVEGETLGGRIVREPRFAAARRVLAHQCGAAMAAIHRLPVAALPALRVASAAQEIAACRASYREAGQARPVFELALQWLQRHLPEPPEPLTLVHGDFRNGNLMVDETGLRAVLDWELAHRGDPMEDLGWICVTSWRFGGEGPVGGFGTREDLYAGYASAGGVVDDARVRFWEVLGVLKWGIACETMSRPHAAGAALGVERAVIGRRGSETELDLLQLLAPREPLAPRTPAGATAVCAGTGARLMQNPPDATALLGSVIAFLNDTAIPKLTGREAFDAKVAVRALGIVQREVGQRPSSDARELARLRTLLHQDATDGALAPLNRLLCDAIAQGRIDLATPGLADHLWATTLDKIAIDQPTYPSYLALVRR